MFSWTAALHILSKIHRSFGHFQLPLDSWPFVWYSSAELVFLLTRGLWLKLGSQGCWWDKSGVFLWFRRTGAEDNIQHCAGSTGSSHCRNQQETEGFFVQMVNLHLLLVHCKADCPQIFSSLWHSSFEFTFPVKTVSFTNFNCQNKAFSARKAF